MEEVISNMYYWAEPQSLFRMLALPVRKYMYSAQALSLVEHLVDFLFGSFGRKIYLALSRFFSRHRTGPKKANIKYGASNVGSVQNIGA